jgi:hypothetical protein
MRVRALAFQQVPFVVEDQHRVKLIRRDLAQPDVDTETQRRAHFQCAPDKQAGFGCLRGVQLVLGAVVATATIGRVRTQAGITEFFAPERPVNEVAQGGLFGPLPG